MQKEEDLRLDSTQLAISFAKSCIWKRKRHIRSALTTPQVRSTNKYVQMRAGSRLAPPAWYAARTLPAHGNALMIGSARATQVSNLVLSSAGRWLDSIKRNDINNASRQDVPWLNFPIRFFDIPRAGEVEWTSNTYRKQLPASEVCTTSRAGRAQFAKRTMTPTDLALRLPERCTALHWTLGIDKHGRSSCCEHAASRDKARDDRVSARYPTQPVN
jgi:hypothetical protein